MSDGDPLSVGVALVVSMFETLAHGQEAIEKRLDAGNERMGGMEGRLGGVELRVKEQNGNVAKVLERQDRHDEQHRDQVSYRAGWTDAKKETKESVQRWWKMAQTDYMRFVIFSLAVPVLLAVGAALGKVWWP